MTDLFMAATEAGTYEAPARESYSLPSMAEIRALEPNGLTSVSTFSGCGGSSLGFRMAGWNVRAAVEFIPEAAATYAANSDARVYQRDIRELTGQQILHDLGLEVGELDCLEGSPPCFPAGTLIRTMRGQVPIEEIQEGDLVLSHKGRWRKVSGTTVREYRGELVRLSFHYGREDLLCTPEHPVFGKIRRGPGGPEAFGGAEWQAAGEIAVGDALVEPSVKDHLAPPEITVKIKIGYRWTPESNYILDYPQEYLDLDSRHVAWMLGYYCAEGWRRGKEPSPESRGASRRGVIFAAHPDEVAFATERGTAAGLRIKASPTAGTAWRLFAGSPDPKPGRSIALEFWYACGMFGDGAGEKFIPEWVFGMPGLWKTALVEGYMFGDGGKPDYGHVDGYNVGATSVSSALSQGIGLLAQDRYQTPVRRLTRRSKGTAIIEGRTVNTRDSYGWSAHPLPLRMDIRKGFHDEHGSWIQVSDVRREAFEGPVYNLHVEEDESYVAGGFAVHNCSSWSSAGNGQTTRERPCDSCGGTGRVDATIEVVGSECPLCSGSGRLAGLAKKYSDSSQRTDDLFEEYVRLIDELRPRSFVAENVPGMLRGPEAQAYAHGVTEKISQLGYRVDARVLNAANFGVPQTRERLIFIGFRNDLGVHPSFPEPTVPEPYTVSDALAYALEDHPEDIADSSMEGKAVGRTWRVITEARAKGLPDPDFTTLPCERCGGDLSVHNDLEVTSTGAITKARCADGEKALITKSYFMLTVPYWDRPSPTVTATGAQTGAASVVHPGECRKFTPAELRAICSFPNDFVLTGSREQRAERMGRAVPPLLYRAVSSHVAGILHNVPDK